ncbi:hypothetical protein AB0C81_26645 [Streptomyces roseoverticillatus]|uniref:hypothetical protein n=1 Tax=Streptomyces roseoverticillatus TaxID=66429 RepID=UPI0033FE2466
MTTTSVPVNGFSENFDAETLALLDAIEVALPEFGDVDLDVVFGTPLEMHEFVTPGELARFEAAAGPRGGRTKARDEIAAEFAARKAAAQDIVAADPSITERVRERLLEALEPSIAEWIREELRGAALSVGTQLLRPLPAVSAPAAELLPLAA